VAAPSGDRSIEGRERSQEQIGHEASPRPKASAWYEELPGWKVDGRPDAVEAPDIDLLLRRPPREGE
jgi:hypothetical protein